jgi:diguanylate cyclase (GGDEF)-like protein
MNRVMISLKKYIESQTEELLSAAMAAYKAALTAMAKAGAEAIPHLGPGLRQKLDHLQANLGHNISVGEIARAQQSVDLELEQWSAGATQYFTDKTKEIQEIMVAVATATEALGERDQRYTLEFSGLTTKLHSIAKLGELSSIRRSIVESASELKAVVGKMAAEGEESISQLRAEVALYRTKLEQSKMREAHDSLTGLAGRSEVESQIEERIGWRRAFCLAIIDLNGFKGVNDTHGHNAGDDALRQFATELKAQFRPTDVVGRWGGDEFVVVVDSDLEEARVRMDRVRQWVFGQYTISTGKGNIEVVMSASIGIASWDRAESAVELIARADERMYTEKKVTSMARRGVA